MKNLRKKFVEFAISNNVLQFGNFKLKSGRSSPYFFNAGLFQDGMALKTLGQFYASLYQFHELNTPHLFGPAYKGILLATITSVALAEVQIKTTVSFNRKESKTHGEGGMLIGSPLSGPTTIIDDVITAGVAFREAKQFIEAYGGHVHSVLIALDRCESGLHQNATIDEIKAMGIQVYSMINVFDIIDYLKQSNQLEKAITIESYQQRYSPAQ